MPVPVAAKVGIVAASVAVAAAIAIYESPEVRRVAEDLRRRIAIALHALGDNVDPSRREPRFNRPEDAHGFYQSHDVDADEETRRRQREELMYWNMRREEERRRASEASQPRSRGSTFDDFLEPDCAGESGTYVFNTGSSAWDTDSSNLLRRRGNAQGVRGLHASVFANPFSDEHGIELEDHAELLPPIPTRDEMMSDIYNATPRALSPVPQPLTEALPAQLEHQPQPQPQSQPVPMPAAGEVLFDFDSHAQPSTTAAEDQHGTSAATARSVTLDRELSDDEYMTAGQEDRGATAAPAAAYEADEAYASIQAWARHASNPGFYSPLPSTPRALASEPELVSAGQLTPTTATAVSDSASLAGSGVDVARDDAVSARGDGELDVLSDSDGDGIPTPGSWSEVGSVISGE